jgi:FtsP/CotA-like multicopper oxidase with cupredoxin domain
MVLLIIAASGLAHKPAMPLESEFLHWPDHSQTNQLTPKEKHQAQRTAFGVVVGTTRDVGIMDQVCHRRSILKAAAGGLVALYAAGCGSSREELFFTEASPQDPFDFPQPSVRSSANGLLETKFDVNFAENFVGDFRLFTRTYEGTLPGPTLRLRPGDTLRLTQINNLPQNTPVIIPLAPNHNDDPGSHLHRLNQEHGNEHSVSHNRPHDFNTFNLHTHGLHVDSGGIADNVFARFEPGTTNLSEVVLPPHHPEGTFWYHPHHHGSSAVQLTGGMAGLIIVEGPTDQVPEIAAARDVSLVIQHLRVNENGEVPEFNSTNALRDADRNFYLVNGEENPVLRMRPGEVQRWRICHASASTFLDLVLDEHTMHQIAQDGLTFDAPREQQRIWMAPGNRSDVLIRAGAPGTYRLRSIDDGEPGPTGQVAIPLVTVVVEGEPVEMGLPNSLPGTPSLELITDSEVAASTAGPNGNGKRVVQFLVHQAPGYNGDPNFPTAFRVVGTGETPPTTSPPGYNSNDFADFSQVPAVCSTPAVLPPQEDLTWGLFDPNIINHTLQLNSVEEWTICGTLHPFHIHINPFLVVAVDGVPLNPPVWMDTVAPAGRTLTIRIRPVEFTGDAVLHCHILDHEDTGMMQRMRVV